MKATLTFDLPEDQSVYDLANHASDMAYVLSEYDNWLRELGKYGAAADGVTEKDFSLDVARKHLHDLMHDNDVDLDRL